MTTTRHPLTLLSLLVLTAAVASACVDDSPDGDDGLACADGQRIESDGLTFCVYEQDVVVEEGFTCPAQVPHLHQSDGLGVCSPEEDLTAEQVDAVVERYRRDDNANNDANNDTVANCIADHPGAPTGAQVDAVAAECEAEGGTGCDPETWINGEAAICIAVASGLPEGLAPPEAQLVFHFQNFRPSWNVNVTLEEQGDSASGDSYRVDAESGEVVARTSWSQMP